MVSKHYNYERYKRDFFISKHMHDDGNIIDEFVVDRNHPHGLEIHRITDKGIIIVYNLNTHKMVTKLIARPQQIRRYYEDSDKEPPEGYEELLKLARQHNILGYNEI